MEDKDSTRVAAVQPHPARVPLFRKICYAAGGVPDGLVLGMVNNFLMVFYVNTLKVDPRLVGWSLFLPRFLDAIMDPLMGQISDNTRSRWGRRRPYVLLGSIVYAIGLFLIFAPPDAALVPLASAGVLDILTHRTGAYLLAACMIFYTGYTIMSVPYAALGAELSTDYHERTRLIAGRNLVTSSVTIVSAATMWLAVRPLWPSERFGWGVVAAAFGVVGTIAMATVALGSRENAEVQKQEKASLLAGLRATFTNGPYAAIILSFLLVITGIFGALPFVYFLNLSYVYPGNEGSASTLIMVGGQVWGVVSTLAVIPAAWLGVRLGKRNAYVSAMLVLCVAAVSTWWVVTPQYPYLQLVFSVIGATAIAGVMLFPLPMIADVCDLDELRTGLRREGAYAGYFSFAFKLGLSLTTLSSGYCLTWAGYDATASVQSPDAIYRLRLMVVFIPTILIGLGAAVAACYPLGVAQVHAIHETLHRRRSGCALPVEE